jgi:hypothetical protein
MTDLREAAQQALKSLRGYRREIGCEQPCDAERALEAALEQPEQEPEQEPVAWMDPNRGEVCRAHWLESHAPERDVDRFSCPLYTHPPRREQPKFTLSCGCPSQHGGVPAYWDRDGSTAFGMICEKHWHEYGARSEA